MTLGREQISTQELARRIRRHAVEMTSRGGSSHVGAVLSLADIVAVLYGRVLRADRRAASAATAI